MVNFFQLRNYLRIHWVVALFLITGCATLTGGINQVIRFESTPSGAKITVGGIEYTTPADISLPRGEEHVITIEKEGYKKASVRLEREFRGLATIGGNILWLLPGVVVDGISGAWYEFEEKTVRVALEPESAAFKAQISYGVVFAAYDSVGQAEQGWSEIWSKYSQMLAGVQPTIKYSSLAGGQLRHHLYGEGLTEERALNLCSYFKQHDEYCLVVQF